MEFLHEIHVLHLQLRLSYRMHANDRIVSGLTTIHHLNRGQDSVLYYDVDMRVSPVSTTVLAIVMILAEPSFAPGQTAAPRRAESESGIRWIPGRPADYGIDPTQLDSIYAAMTEDPHHDLKGIVIVRDRRLVSEHYFKGDSADTLHDIRSATKSLTSLLMGIAIQKGPVHSVNDSIALYLPGLPKDGKERITIEHLLTMRSGLDAYDDDASSPGNESRLDASSD